MQLICQIKIIGRVQGVGYRQSAKDIAEQLGLTGWVKNCPDGSVKSKAIGTEDKVHEFIAWCRKGPASALVKEVQVEWLNEIPATATFEIR